MNRRLKLLLVSKSTGGVASYIRMLVKGLDREKFDITVACLSENGQEFAEELRQNYKVDAFSLAMNRYKINPLTDARVLIQLSARIRRERYDLIHAHASKPGFLIRIAAVGTGIPVIYSPHNFAFHEGSKPLVARVVALFEKFAALFTTQIIAVAKHERDLALKYGVGKPELYSVIPTGIDPVLYQQPADVLEIKRSLGIPDTAQVIGTVGRLAVPKLPIDFVRVAAELKNDFSDLHFVWVGSGPLQEEAQALTNELGLKDSVHWLGHRDDAYRLYNIFNCFLLLSRWEANPLVLLEAFSAGVPVIASDNLGARELIGDGGHGILVPVADVSAVSNAIRSVLQNPDRASAMKRLALEEVSRVFSLERMISKIEEVYLEKAISL
ncbi:MAG: glycosyltransferase family 4 protein [Anaerolineae bacterium]|nr:glycosyltransferase family 4 protein [Anaerolineae bacterium]